MELFLILSLTPFDTNFKDEIDTLGNYDYFANKS